MIALRSSPQKLLKLIGKRKSPRLKRNDGHVSMNLY